jgi:CheY-like chemotaxis protein
VAAPNPPSAGDTRFDGLAVLLVEDNERLRGMIARTLESLGCTVVAAGEAAEAMRLLQAGSVVQLMLSDIRMPGTTDGVALAEWVSAHYPGIAILLVTGFTHTANIRFAVLSKPFGLDQLIEAMGRALGPAYAPDAA